MRPKGTAAELEVRRRIAADLLSKGRSLAEIADAVSASVTSVKRWKKAWREGGMPALAAKPHPGPRRKMSSSQQTRLCSLLRAGPRRAGFATELWTCARVAHVIKREFDIEYHVDHVGRLLRNLGWTPQKPARRARERDEAVIRRWRQRDWPRIKRGREPKGRALFFWTNPASCCSR